MLACMLQLCMYFTGNLIFVFKSFVAWSLLVFQAKRCEWPCWRRTLIYCSVKADLMIVLVVYEDIVSGITRYWTFKCSSEKMVSKIWDALWPNDKTGWFQILPIAYYHFRTYFSRLLYGVVFYLPGWLLCRSIYVEVFWAMTTKGLLVQRILDNLLFISNTSTR